MLSSMYRISKRYKTVIMSSNKTGRLIQKVIIQTQMVHFKCDSENVHKFVC